jgi:hypothetical protein
MVTFPSLFAHMAICTYNIRPGKDNAELRTNYLALLNCARKPPICASFWSVPPGVVSSHVKYVDLLVKV